MILATDRTGTRMDHIYRVLGRHRSQAIAIVGSAFLVAVLLGNLVPSAAGSRVAVGGTAPAHPGLVASDTAAAQMAAAQASLSHTSGAARLAHPSCSPSSSSRCAPVAPGLLGPPYSPTWLNITNLSLSVPSSRSCYAMAYDAADGYVLLFGGCTSGGRSVGGTWSFSAGKWTRLTPPSGPANRSWASMTYDAADTYVLLFGGEANSSSLVDTWSFHAGLWTSRTSGTHPQGRNSASMAYDAKDGYVVLFGGYNATNFADLRDTWTYLGGTWTHLTWTNVNSYPTVRELAPMAYNPANGTIVLFGGNNVNLFALRTDTWTFVKGNWTKQNATIAPTGREGSAIAYDPVLGHVVLFAGDDTAGLTQDVWQWGGHNWTKLNATLVPSKRTLNVLAWDTADGYGVMWGGGSSSSGTGAFYTDTWALGINFTASLTVAPSAMDVGQTTAIKGNAVANITTTFTYVYTGLPPGCTAANQAVLSCSPTTAGNYSLHLNVTDGRGNLAQSNATLNVSPGLGISRFTVTPSVITLKEMISFSLLASGGVGWISYVYTGTPTGCSTLNLSSWSCTPRSTGNFTVVGTVGDSLGGRKNSTVALTVNTDPKVVSITATSPTLDVGESTTLNVVATGGTVGNGHLIFAYTGLPAPCASANSSTLTCAPSSPGVYPILVNVTDFHGFTSNLSTSITVNPAPKISNFNVSQSVIDIGQSVTFLTTASLGTGILVYSYTGLPTGCTGTNDTSVFCTPTGSGSFTVGVTVTDAVNGTASSSTKLIVSPLPTVTLTLAPAAQFDIGGSITLQAAVTGGTGIYTYSYSNLPHGCAAANSSTIACTPSTTGTFLVNLGIRDSAGLAASAHVVVTINSLPSIYSFTVSAPAVNPGTLVTFTALAKGGTGPKSYLYSGLPGGCATANTSSFNCTPNNPGTYNVSVKVTDSVGSSTSSYTLFVINRTSNNVGPSGGGISPTLEYGIIGAVIVVVVVAAALLMRRRGPSTAGSAADETDSPPGEGPDGGPVEGGDGDLWPATPPASPEGETIYGSEPMPEPPAPGSEIIE